MQQAKHVSAHELGPVEDRQDARQKSRRCLQRMPVDAVEVDGCLQRMPVDAVEVDECGSKVIPLLVTSSRCLWMRSCCSRMPHYDNSVTCITRSDVTWRADDSFHYDYDLIMYRSS